MDHKHDYETVNRPSVTPEVGSLGIRSAELRKCRICEHEMPFVETKNGWFPLYEEKEAEEQDILLA